MADQQYQVPAPITINGLSASWETHKKGLEGVTLKSATSIFNFIPLLYRQGTFRQKTMKKKVYAGLPEAGTWDAQSVIDEVGLEFLYDVTATHYWYANATAYTLEARTFDEYNLFLKLAGELGKSLGVKRQKLALALFNGGFEGDFAGTGVPFFSAAHPDDKRLGSAVPQSNLVPGPLSVTTLTEAINLLINVHDPLGRPKNLLPKRLFVYPTKVITAKQFLGVNLGLEYGTTDHNRNPFQDFKIEVIPCPWLKDPEMWILQGNEIETYYSEPVPIRTRTKEDEDHSTRHEGWFADTFWAEGWEGYVGSPGV